MEEKLPAPEFASDVDLERCRSGKRGSELINVLVSPLFLEHCRSELHSHHDESLALEHRIPDQRKVRWSAADAFSSLLHVLESDRMNVVAQCTPSDIPGP